MSILPILCELKESTGAGSASKKLRILKNNKDNEDLKDFFFYCLDPSINFWQTKIKKYNKSERLPKISLAEAIKKTEKLRNRAITGNKAIECLSEINASLSNDDQNVFNRIITRKPGVGMNSSSINKIWPNLIYSSPYMRCKGYSDKLVKNWDWNNVCSQLKCDGMFFNIPLHKNEFETRSGEQIDLRNEDITYAKKLLYDILSEHFENPVLHGEAVCYKNGDPMERSKSNGLINKLKLGSELPIDVEIKLITWDIIPYENFINKIPFKVPYRDKFFILVDAINQLQISTESSIIDYVEYRRIFSKEQAKEHFSECIRSGQEGTVLKNGAGIWKPHDSPNQLKMKNEFSFELKITGFKDGNGKFSSTFGSIKAESEDSLLTTFISGINDKERKHINDNRGSFIGKIIEVKASGLFQNNDGTYSPMHPRYIETRYDKTEADTLQKIIQQEKDSIELL